MSVFRFVFLSRVTLTAHSIRELQMAPCSDHLPRRHFRPRLPSHPLPSLWHQHDLGRHLQGGDRYLIFPRGSDYHQKVQDDICLVYCHGCHDGRTCRCGPCRQTGTLRLANHGVCHDLATGKHRLLPFFVAVSAQSWVDAIYLLGLLLLIGQSSPYLAYRTRYCEHQNMFKDRGLRSQIFCRS